MSHRDTPAHTERGTCCATQNHGVADGDIHSGDVRREDVRREEATARDTALGDATPRGTTAGNAVPREHAPGDGAPAEHAPGDGAPADCAPGDGAPADGVPGNIAAVARARWALMGIFVLLGLTMSSWLSRLPSIRDSLGINEAEIGVVLLVGAIGSLITVAVAGPLVARFGGLLMMHVATGGFAVGFMLLVLGVSLGSVALLSAGIFCNGMSFALNNVPINVEAAAVERRMGRTVIPQFHAGFSIGALLGTFVGAAASWAQVSVEVQFTVAAVVVVVWRLIAVPRIILDTLPDGAPAAVHRAPRRVRLATSLSAWRERRTLMLGFVIMAASLSEGAANDWLSLAVVDGFGGTEAIGALVFGAFVGSMTILRIAGTRLIDDYGRVRVLRLSGAAAIAGLALFGVAPNLPVAVAGVSLWGFGAALAFPIGIAAASDDPLRAAARVSVVTAFSSVASLAAPPLLGLVAHQIGARYALTLIIAVLLVSVSLARYADPTRQKNADADSYPGDSPVTPVLPVSEYALSTGIGEVSGAGRARDVGQAPGVDQVPRVDQTVGLAEEAGLAHAAGVDLAIDADQTREPALA